MTDIQRHCGRGNHFAPQSRFRVIDGERPMLSKDCLACEEARTSALARRRAAQQALPQVGREDDAKFPGLDMDRIYTTLKGRRKP